MRQVKVAALLFSCSRDVQENINKAEKMVREAADNDANIILLPELFERQYFCQEKRYDYYDYALPLEKNPAVNRFKEVAKEFPVSFYERDIDRLFNTVAMIDADGSVLGIYRKTHIPDDHFYQEKFYFTPGDTGSKVFDIRFGCIGVGICWDQWFPEAARCMAVQGAEMLLYPTAIGSEPILDVDSSSHWRRVMQGHAAANLMPVVTANRIGVETVGPCKKNAGQSSSLDFYGCSFIADATGDIIASAKQEETILYGEFDLDALKEDRLSWGLFRDRRPETYVIMTKK